MHLLDRRSLPDHVVPRSAGPFSYLSLATGFALLGTAATTVVGRDFPFFQPVQPARATQVVAHRGEAGQAPENTRPALVRCIEDNIEWAEIDLRLTKDGQHVLAHDDRLQNGLNADLVVAEHTLDELKRIDLGSRFAGRFAGERLLTLRECFELAKGKLNLYLDCKAVNPEQLTREVLDAGMERQVVVYDRPEALQRIYQLAPGKLALMAKWRPVEIDANEITTEICQAFHARGVKVETKNLGDWDRPTFWEKARAAGADWI